MDNKRKKPSASHYKDISPKARSLSNYTNFGKIGPIVSGFDNYGYPMVKNVRLPSPFRLEDGRVYGASQSSIKPMQISSTSKLVKPGIARVDRFRLKPSPSVPGAPADLPSRFDFCVQEGDYGYFFRYRNPNAAMHGANAHVSECGLDDSGMTICSVRIPGADHDIIVPLCSDRNSDKEPVSESCCVRLLGDDSAQIVCNGSSYDLMIVKIVNYTDIDGIRIVSVEHPDLPGGGARLPVCEPINEEPDERPCCIDGDTGEIICPEGLEFPLNGMKIPLEFLEFADNIDGMSVARLLCGDINNIAPSEIAENNVLNAMYNVCEQLGGYIFQVCTKRSPKHTLPKKPSTKLPDVCCYDPDSGTLICEGTIYHSTPVTAISETVINGMRIVSVESESLPGGGLRVPLCEKRREPSHDPENSSSDESEGDSDVRDDWTKTINAPVKFDKCDKKWLELSERLKSANYSGHGRRSSSLRVPKCSPRFPGLRGLRREI